MKITVRNTNNKSTGDEFVLKLPAEGFTQFCLLLHGG